MFKNIKIRTKIIVSFLLIVFPAILIGFFSFYNLNQLAGPLNQQMTDNIKNLTKESELNNLASLIKYYDERLTQSARNYAFTGKEEWKNRYNEEAPALDNAIKLAISRGDQEDKSIFSGIDVANIALVDLEEKSMSLVEGGQREKAIEVLESQEYWQQKEIYKKVLNSYFERRDVKYDQAIVSSGASLKKVNEQASTILNITIISTILYTILTALLAFFLLLINISSIVIPLKKLENYANKIITGQEKINFEAEGKDEISSLAKALSRTIGQLKEAKKDVELRVKERTEQLEKLNKYMIGREIKMIELKKEINKLEEK